MKTPILLLSILATLLLSTSIYYYTTKQHQQDDLFLSYTVDAKSSGIKMFWKNDSGEVLGNFQRLDSCVKTQHSRLLFAMNAGMFTAEYSPLGLFVEKGKVITPLNMSSGKGNFYLRPGGVFYVTNDKRAGICTVDEWKNTTAITYATQSGPMLVINGKIHPDFVEKSTNLNVRNGVGILPNNDVLFVMSKKEVNFYTFARYFQSMGCTNALYLDGFVSRAYLPEKKWEQTDGQFGVMIGVLQFE